MEEKFSFFEIQQKNQKARAGSFKSNVIEVKSWLILLDTYSYVYIGDRSQILAHFLAYILVYVHVHHCKAIEVKSWLIFLDTYSYVNVHHCKAIELKSWLIFLDTYSYVNVHHCKAIELKSWLIFLDTY